MAELRDYQRAAIDGVYSWFERSSGNPLVVVPTGGGKSVIAAEFIREIMVEAPGERILVVTHVKELVEQNHAALLRSWPEGLLRVGINSAAMRRRDTRSSVLFASVQSVYRSAAALGHFDLVLVDEAHLIPPSGFGMYQTLLGNLRTINPQVKLIGLTATPYRTDTGSLDKGDDRLFHGIAYECDIVALIEAGWLSPVTNQGVKEEIDTTGVAHRGGEFVAGELEVAAMRDGIVPRSIEELMSRAAGRRSWLLFACGIEHAKEIASELAARDVVVETVFGHTKPAERDRIIAAFRAGEITAIVNVGVLTTGFDAPNVDLIALMRPTESPGLYVQMVGRGLRRAEGKTDCLVLDFAGNVMRHGPIDRVRPRQPGKPSEDYEVPMKKCPECLLLVHTSTSICPKCDYQFPATRGKPNHDVNPDETNMLLAGRQPAIQRWDVVRRIAGEHNKPGKPVSMRVTYLCGYKREVSEWICFEHEGFARRKAEQWWRKMGGQEPVPETVDLALVRMSINELKNAISVTVDTTGEYPQLKNVRLDEGGEAGWRADAESAKQSPLTTGTEDYQDIPF